MRFFQYNYFCSYINSHGHSWLIKGNQNSGAAKLTYRAFYNKNIKFGAVIPWTILISFERGRNLAHAH